MTAPVLPESNGHAPLATTYSPFGSALLAPKLLTPAEKSAALQTAGLASTDKLACLIIGMKLHEHDRTRDRNLECLLTWIDHFYGDLFDVLLVEQGTQSRAGGILAKAKPYVRHEFLYNPDAYNRGWGYNVAVKHMTKAQVVALMDTDVLTGSNFVDAILRCHKHVKAISPYAHVYFTDAGEAEHVMQSFDFGHLRRPDGVSKPTTITGGVVILRRQIYEALAGFEQYTEYGGEDRSLDVTLLNHCDRSEIELAPYAYVHLWHPRGGEPRPNTKGLVAHLRDEFGCSYDPKLTPESDLHQGCKHVPKYKTARNLLARRVAYGDPDLYRIGKPLSINGAYKTEPTEIAEQVQFPPDILTLGDYEKKEQFRTPAPDTDRLAQLYNLFMGRRCFIIGNIRQNLKVS